jgi:hypothetical protein
MKRKPGAFKAGLKKIRLKDDLDGNDPNSCGRGRLKGEIND